MTMKVAFQNPKTSETKTVKVGWSWVLFFFSSFFGLPLFLRGLHVWGGVMAGLWGASWIIPPLQSSVEDALVVNIVIGLIGLGLAIWFAIKGNEMTAKNYLEKGWKMLDPGSAAAKHARSKWGLPETPPSDTEGA